MEYELSKVYYKFQSMLFNRKVSLKNPQGIIKERAEEIAEGLYPHQIEGVAFLLGRRRALLADDMGLGKTRQSIIARSPTIRHACSLTNA